MRWVLLTAAGLALVVVASGSAETSAAADGRAAAVMLGIGAVLAAGATVAAGPRTGDPDLFQ